jgi:hypothetical protein
MKGEKVFDSRSDGGGRIGWIDSQIKRGRIYATEGETDFFRLA